jgi:hypothetical protein
VLFRRSHRAACPVIVLEKRRHGFLAFSLKSKTPSQELRGRKGQRQVLIIVVLDNRQGRTRQDYLGLEWRIPRRIACMTMAIIWDTSQAMEHWSPPPNAKRDPANWSQTQNGSKWQLQTGVLLNNTKTAIPFTDTFSLSLPQKKHFSCASLLGYQLLSTLRFFLFF